VVDVVHRRIEVQRVIIDATVQIRRLKRTIDRISLQCVNELHDKLAMSRIIKREKDHEIRVNSSCLQVDHSDGRIHSDHGVVGKVQVGSKAESSLRTICAAKN